MSEKIKVGLRGQFVIPKKLQEKFNIRPGTILEINETKEGLLLKLFNPVVEMKGLGKGIFSDPIKYQKEIREE